LSLTYSSVGELYGHWSASTSRLVAPPINLFTVGSRVSPVAAAQVWNSLPKAIVSSSSLQTFRRQLKLIFSTFIPALDFLAV